MNEYAFDVKLFAVVRVKAANEQMARKGLATVIDCLDLSHATIDGMNDVLEEIKITEVSLDADDSCYEQGAELFEVNGEEPEENDHERTTHQD